MNFIIIKLKSNQQGQTLMEVIFVALIFLLVMTSIISTYLYLSRAQKVEEGQAIAAQSAREGIEMVRNIRDSNWLDQAKDWKDGLYFNANSVIETARIEWDPPSGQLILNFDVNQIGQAEIYEHGSGHHKYWNQESSGGQPIGFYRLITLEKVCDEQNFPPTEACGSGDEIIGFKVTAEVEWQAQGGDKNYQLVDYLYNWK